MSERFSRRLRKVTTEWKGSDIRTAGGHLVTPIGMCTARIEIRGETCAVKFVVLPNCSRDIILGMDFLCEYAAVIDLGSNSLTLRRPSSPECEPSSTPVPARVVADHVKLPARTAVFLLVQTDAITQGEVYVEGSVQLLLDRGIGVARGVAPIENGQARVLVTNFWDEPQYVTKGMVIAHAEEMAEVTTVAAISETEQSPKRKTALTLELDVDSKLPLEQRRELLDLLTEFNDCFATLSGVGRTGVAKHRILTDEATHPTRQSPYRVSPIERQAIENQVREMLRDDVIQPSNSPWAAPVVLVKKKDGTMRFCVDYRRLNKVTKKDLYPLPRIDDTLDRLRHARYFSSIDLKSGYWQIEVDERDREKTAFITPDGLYEFKVMPFGLCTAPATFQRVMDTVLAGLKWKTCLVYLDDVVIFSRTFEEHMIRLREVLEALKSAGLTLNPNKCRFGYDELKFLGHIVSNKGVSVDPAKTTAVQAFPTPSDKKAVRRFLGLCAYYRRFVPSFSQIAAPLTYLTKDDVPFQWTEEQQCAFEKLKEALLTTPVLAHFDQDSPTEIHTDASDKGLGAVLIQRQEGDERVIAYASRALSKAEGNYTTTEKECLAVVWAITKFRPYLYGRPFHVVTDHHSLCWLANLRDPAGRLARWGLRLQEFDFTITHKSGRKHSDADCLSRAPVELPQADTNDDDDAFLGALQISDMASRQRRDPVLRKLFARLEGQDAALPHFLTRHLSTFCVRNDVLYKKNFKANSRSYLLVVPDNLRDEIMQACHDDPTAGHLGYSRTLARIREKYYWPHLPKTVHHYTKTCRECQRRKKPARRPAGFLQPIEPPTTPFQQVGMDLLGPFPKSNAHNRWIIIATDYLTRYAESKALPSGTTAEIAAFFIQSIVLRHGAPKVLITDRGSAFRSQLTQDILRLSNTTHRQTTAYHPQTNGLTERLNKTITDMISMYVDVEHRTWDEVLPFVTFAYNTAVQETTGFSPFHLVHGRPVTTMLDAMLPHIPSESTHEDARMISQTAEEARQLARVRIQDQQRVDAHRYNLRRRNVSYRPGDRVWVWTPVRRRGLSDKLLKRYFGPYKVLSRFGDLNYEVIPDGVRSSTRTPKSEVVHVVRLKPYYERDDNTPPAEFSSPWHRDDAS